MTQTQKRIRIPCSEIEKNIQRILKLPKSSRRKILQDADKKIPKEETTSAIFNIRNLVYDRNFCKRTGIDYNNPDVEVIKTAYADCLLRNLSDQ